MKVVLRPHLKIRLKQRKIPLNYPREILLNPDNKYHDALSLHQIAVKRMLYGGKIRSMAISYDIIGSEVEIITIHQISEQAIENRLLKERWIKYEKT